MSKDQEKALFERFKSNYEDFPATIEERIDGQEKPDSIIITENGRKVGIELTEMFQDNLNSKSNGSDLRETEGKYQDIGDSIVEKVEQQSSNFFHLNISFSRNANLRKESREEIISKLSSLIIKYLPTLESNEMLAISDFWKMPEGVDVIFISTHPQYTESLYCNSQAGGIMDLTNEHIETVLRDKNERLEKYEECDEQWLVIKIGHFLAGSFGKNKIGKSFETKFDKIFLHNTQTSKTLELEVLKCS